MRAQRVVRVPERWAGLVIAIALVAGSAHAQEPAAGDPPQPPLSPEVLATVPAMDCEQPKIPERASMPRDDIDYLYKRVNAYNDCISQYITARQAEVKRYGDLSRAQADAANAVVSDFNAYRERLKAFDEKHNKK